MKYKGFYVKIIPDENIHREDKDGAEVVCKGYDVDEIFADGSGSIMLDAFTAAVDHELLNDSIDEVEQLIKDYIDCEEKEWRKEIDMETEVVR